VHQSQDVGLERSAGLFRTSRLNLVPGTAADGADDWTANECSLIAQSVD
jgi:hypothetical protein